MSSECLWLLNYVKEKQNKNPDFHFAGKNAKLHKYIKVFHFYAAIGTVAVCKQGECNCAGKSGNGPLDRRCICEKTNVRFLNYTSAALADKSHLVLRVIRKIYKKSSEIKRPKFCFLPQP